MGKEYSATLLFTQAMRALHVDSVALPYVCMGDHYLTASEIRRDNLLTLVREFKTQRALADAVGIAPAQISQWATSAPDSKTGTPRVIGDDSARTIEGGAGRPIGWMDHDHSRAGTVGCRPQPTRQAPPAVLDLAHALPVVLGALAGLTAGQWRMVRARLDDLPEQPAAAHAVLADVAPLLGLAAPTPAAAQGDAQQDFSRGKKSA